ncbi:NAD(P)/FAD-dependent oxidoreductase [Roseiterribacter gracilis]|uniref:FAD-dependent catabolic D-arginine dehydrogenase DauA n=1 Tax=Roseiterribacter gracilis TaxID=2812848 RepID=A0A8S8X761_9PROT|nr:FAD-dependent catabolic D-arginine dehydrogenase DauA [Rhodospirillales bacterium TMPK1]
MTIEIDALVIGAGMAGASIGAELARDRNVVLLERESQPGYHSTGRSAALFSECYGNRPVRALSRASRNFFFNPPAGFTSVELTKARGALHVATKDQLGALEGLRAQPDFAAQTKHVDGDEARALAPILTKDWVAGLYEREARDVDVHALHQAYLAALRERGSSLRTDTVPRTIERKGDRWKVETGSETFLTPLLVNAGGAWADVIAQQAGVKTIGLVPMRRTAILLEAPAGHTVDSWPMVIDAEEQFYFKPDAGTLLVSPADETPSEPCDAQPDELDVAIAVERFEQATTERVRRISHRWAGLRSFVADRAPVVGYAKNAPGFFWVAGQGGYGIQTAPGLSAAAAALARNQALPEFVAREGVTASDLSPDRFAD